MTLRAQSSRVQVVSYTRLETHDSSACDCHSIIIRGQPFPQTTALWNECLSGAQLRSTSDEPQMTTTVQATTQAAVLLGSLYLAFCSSVGLLTSQASPTSSSILSSTQRKCSNNHQQQQCGGVIYHLCVLA